MQKQDNIIFPPFLISAFIFVLIVIYSTSCIRSKDNIIASINDSIKIYRNEIDLLIEQELYESLYKIYLQRHQSLEKTIDQKIIEIEAKQKGVTPKELIETQVKKNYNQGKLEKYMELNGLKNRIPYFNGFLTYVSVDSKLGKELLDEAFRKDVVKSYVEKLRKRHKIETWLSAPLSPRIKLDSLDMVHYTGNLNSGNTLIIISDIECSACREAEIIYKNLYDKYNKKLKIGFVAYSGHINIGIKALEAAGIQGKYFEMKEKLIMSPLTLDTVKFVQYARQLNMDTSLCIRSKTGCRF